MDQRPRRKRRFIRPRKKVCYFCVNKQAKIDYKNADLLSRFINEKGRILSRRITGTCAKHQRMIAKTIKRSREASIINYVFD